MPKRSNIEKRVAAVGQAVRDKDYTEAERMLSEWVIETEQESDTDGLGVAPWPYEQLAIIYRKQSDASKEIDVLERFSRQKHAPGAMPRLSILIDILWFSIFCFIDPRMAGS